MAGKFRPGVLTGQEVSDLLNYANEKNFALPAVNCRRYQYRKCSTRNGKG